MVQLGLSLWIKICFSFEISRQKPEFKSLKIINSNVHSLNNRKKIKSSVKSIKRCSLKDSKFLKLPGLNAVRVTLNFKISRSWRTLHMYPESPILYPSIHHFKRTPRLVLWRYEDKDLRMNPWQLQTLLFPLRKSFLSTIISLAASEFFVLFHKRY